VLVRVKELPLQTATFGAGYSANTGPRITFEHLHRRVFGTRWVAKNKFEFGPDQKLWSGELISHPLEGLYRNLVAGSAERLRTTDELRTSWSARFGRTQDTQRIERLYYAEYVSARLLTASTATNSDSRAISGNYHWVFRNLDSVLLPTQGYSLSAQTALGLARSTTADNGPFGRAYARLTGYWPLGLSWYGTARVEAGQVFAKDSVGVPDTLLFRAGGDESVRGYAYRALGPLVGGVVTSGRMLLTGSIELARPLSATRPAFWWAVFADAGNASNRWSDFDPATGYGIGLRWRSPVGPLRLDLAYGQQVHAYRVHLSVGIAF
jgi:translocation and assembly module TamA